MTKSQLTAKFEEKYGLFMNQKQIAEATQRSRNRINDITDGLDVYQPGKRDKRYLSEDVAAKIISQSIRGYESNIVRRIV